MQEAWFKGRHRSRGSRSAATPAPVRAARLDRAAVLATAIIGVIGVIIQQVFLRWNQGQDLRQALITIALSVIFADQMLAAFGGISKDIKAPSDWPTSITLPGEVRFGFFRAVVVLGAAILIGLGLWMIIKRTRFGKIVRAGVDDRDMVSGLGINAARRRGRVPVGGPAGRLGGRVSAR
jgi:branched-chain amino acid transport system permease protein